jgi:hypothetical protein
MRTEIKMLPRPVSDVPATVPRAICLHMTCFALILAAKEVSSADHDVVKDMRVKIT